MALTSYVNKFPNQGLKTHPDETGHVQGGMTVDETSVSYPPSLPETESLANGQRLNQS